MTRAELYAQLKGIAALDATLTTQLHGLACAVNAGLTAAAALDAPELQEDIAALLATFPELGAQALDFAKRVAYWQSVEVALMALIEPEPTPRRRRSK